MGNTPSRGGHHSHNQHNQQHQQQQQQHNQHQQHQQHQTSQQSSSSSSPYAGSPSRSLIDQRRGSLPHHHHHFFHHHYQTAEPAKPVLQTPGFNKPSQAGSATAQKTQEYVSIDPRSLDPRSLDPLQPVPDAERNTAAAIDLQPKREVQAPPARRQSTPVHFPLKVDTVVSPEVVAIQNLTLDPSGAGGGGIGDAQRRMSMQSTTTIEEDEMPFDDSKTIPTLVTWLHGGNKVYITGTFCEWRKKYRLTKSPDSNVLSAVVPLPAGTHHVKFLVDGELRTSDALPTAVDSNGILVNYLEVSAEDMLAPLERQPTPEHLEETFCSSRPKQRYTDVIPAYLRDWEEKQDRYGGNYQPKLPPPPSLPMMLGKVILNTNSSLKDDNSVLAIPNHVVLNHLATSSIKNHVLAVSATTRYKKKYVSTILYKSTTE